MRHAVSARNRDEDARRKRTEALVTSHLRELFDRVPALAGFRVRRDLVVSDLSFFDWPIADASRSSSEIVMQSLLELAERNPEAIVFMRGRTFARNVH